MIRWRANRPRLIAARHRIDNGVQMKGRIPLSGSIRRRTNGEWERIKFVLQVSQDLVDDLSILAECWRFLIHLKPACRNGRTNDVKAHTQFRFYLQR